jgi:hypothetical protein
MTGPRRAGNDPSRPGDDSPEGGATHSFWIIISRPPAAGAPAVREGGTSRYATWDGRRHLGRDVARM